MPPDNLPLQMFQTSIIAFPLPAHRLFEAMREIALLLATRNSLFCLLALALYRSKCFVRQFKFQITN
jgi:hypothetical protein